MPKVPFPAMNIHQRKAAMMENVFALIPGEENHSRRCNVAKAIHEGEDVFVALRAVGVNVEDIEGLTS